MNFGVIIKNSLLMGAVLLWNSCIYESKDELRPSRCQTANMSYADSINPILVNYGCVSCHNSNFSSGGVNLDGYSNVKFNVDNEAMIKSIRHEMGFSAMPPSSPKMDQCDIDRIKSWIQDGAPNN